MTLKATSVKKNLKKSEWRILNFMRTFLLYHAHVLPVEPLLYIHDNRHGHFGDSLHNLSNYRDRITDSIGTNLEQKLVMYLQKKPYSLGVIRYVKRARNFNHSALYEIRLRSLDWRIDRHPLCLSSYVLKAGLKIRQIAAAPEERRDIPVFSSFGNHPLAILLNAREINQILPKILLAFCVSHFHSPRK